VQFENISSLESMPACRIENLNIASGNSVTSLKGVNNLPKAGVALRTDGCPLSDVSDAGRSASTSAQ
jgi:hypothetical protein